MDWVYFKHGSTDEVVRIHGDDTGRIALYKRHGWTQVKVRELEADGGAASDGTATLLHPEGKTVSLKGTGYLVKKK